MSTFSTASNTMFRWMRGWLVLGMVVMLGTWPGDAQAQRRPGAIGLGAQIGEPSGVTLQVYRPQAVSYDFLAAWDLDDFVFLNVHGLYEQHLDRQGQVHLFYGPGAFIGFRDRPGDRDDDTVAGISGRIGIGFLIDRFEIYGQITPRLALAPATEGDIGGGLGFRFFFQ
ncbi:MAG: hypothetical protein D6746_11330 [Bacteroidetes bacterium]|nr:MAG: hypothetical protein D6746_11330 [Bacteroidota bacterium]